MKRKHFGAQSRKHGCCRCHEHKSRVTVYVKKTGAKYALCDHCARGRKLEVA